MISLTKWGGMKMVKDENIWLRFFPWVVGLALIFGSFIEVKSWGEK